MQAPLLTIGLYRDVWIAAIASSTTSLATRTAAICVRFQGRRLRRVYVTMQITFLTRKSALIYRRDLRQRVASLTLNCNGVLAIRAYKHAGIRMQKTLTVRRRAHPRARARTNEHTPALFSQNVTPTSRTTCRVLDGDKGVVVSRHG